MAETTSKGEEKGQETVSASQEANEKLEHSVEGSTTRDDNLDVGVPMLQGDPSEPPGPEDALGAGPKRGDYASRQDGSDHYETVPNPKAGEPIYAGKGDDRTVVNYEPAFTLVYQNPRVEDVGEVEGKKGGVETADEA